MLLKTCSTTQHNTTQDNTTQHNTTVFKSIKTITKRNTAGDCLHTISRCIVPSLPGRRDMLFIQATSVKESFPVFNTPGYLRRRLGTHMRPPAPGVAAGGWVVQRTLMGALQGLIHWTFPCHTEHLLGWKRDALESFWQLSGEELLPPALPGPFSALVPFPRTAPPAGCRQHCRSEQAAAPGVGAAGQLGPQRPSQALRSQPRPARVTCCPQECFSIPLPKVVSPP